MQPDEDARVARLERQVAFLLQHLGLDPGLAAGGGSQGSTFRSQAEIFGTQAGYRGVPSGFGASPSGYAPSPSGAGFPPAGPNAAGGADEVPAAVLAAIQRGKMIDAIKIYRQMTGLGLREAKNAVDDIARRQR